MQCELAETKQRMEVVLVTDIFMELPNSQNWPWTSRSTGANPAMSQDTSYAQSGSRNKSKSFTVPLLVPHHTHSSQLLDVSIKKEKIVAWHFLFWAHWSEELNSLAFACVIQTPVTSSTLISGLAILQLKIQKWNPATNAEDAPLEKWKGVDTSIIALFERSKQHSWS